MRKNSEINYRCDSVNEIVPTKEKVCPGGVINGKSDHVKKEKEENSTSKREKKMITLHPVSRLQVVKILEF